MYVGSTGKYGYTWLEVEGMEFIYLRKERVEDGRERALQPSLV